MSYYRRTAERAEGSTLWWEVALGVFLALMAHSLVTGLWQRWEIRQAMKALEREAERFPRQPVPAPEPEPQAEIRYLPGAHAAPLRAGERCIHGRRFRRVENGWVQVPHEPC